MYKKKFFFIVFEGIEGSVKSYQSRKLHENLNKNGVKSLLTREPGGSKGAEQIRKIILKDYFYKNKNEQFDKYTDTLLYLAARNEHIRTKIKPAILKKNIIICDRFIDSTFAYQVYGKGVNKNFINFIHKYVLKGLKPDLTFVLKIKISSALKRLRKRKKKNRYDKFAKSFYLKAQKAFIKIANKNKKRYYIFDNSFDNKEVENKIFNIVRSKINL